MGSILVGIDGSHSADRALGWAIGAARQTGAELVLVGAVEGDDVAAAERSMAREWAMPAERAGQPFRTMIRQADPRQLLPEIAAAEGVDLVVVGAGHERWFPALHLGSASHYLAHHLDRPLAIVPAEGGEFDAQRLVVGLDGSPGSVAACKWAASTARASGGTVTAVHAWQRSGSHSHNVALALNCQKDALTAVTVWAQPLRDAGVFGQAQAIESHPADALTKALAESDSRLLVIGTRGAGGFRELRLGSAALRVIQVVQAPTVLVPPAP